MLCAAGIARAAVGGLGRTGEDWGGLGCAVPLSPAAPWSRVVLNSSLVPKAAAEGSEQCVCAWKKWKKKARGGWGQPERPGGQPGFLRARQGRAAAASRAQGPWERHLNLSSPGAEHLCSKPSCQQDGST